MPPTDVEVVARLKQPFWLSGFQALATGLEAAYGPGLLMQADDEAWLSIVRPVRPQNGEPA